MAPSLLAKLRLLSEQTKTSIEERDRLRLLKVPISAHDDREIVKSLHTIHDGLLEIENDLGESTYDQNQFKKLCASCSSILDLYKNDPDASKDIDYESLKFIPSRQAPASVPRQSSLASSSPSSAPSQSKSVRFKDKVVDTERFIQPYRDFPDEEDEESRASVPPLSSSDLYENQQQLIRDQDAHLDSLSQSVSRQHELSIQIDSELDSHLELLDDVDNLADRSQDRLALARKRLDIFSHKARQHGSSITIAILALILVILLVVLS
ncbi:hypothetical protein AWJ20_1856 [Sugiyamaella lignohabitans]|uniref:t-SNARE coiled-coil homology domain-containing protein n=1 Tax=Sugiyamaella lignohabitans TaxID=796027 RepID=A0A167E2B0_9ASCO|nr:uncharacterized protein AWJ20_1856 [Sugiyamaella lignohabitans]ANB13560.1 hypothetical protein AWJ20_1856 [Sugiyamaella lignohabitans]